MRNFQTSWLRDSWRSSGLRDGRPVLVSSFPPPFLSFSFPMLTLLRDVDESSCPEEDVGDGSSSLTGLMSSEERVW